jgi:hypothetical protein
MLCNPNYGNSILNVISSVRRFYRCSYLYPSHECTDNELDKRYSNIVLMVISGMGSDIVRKNVQNGSFLKSHKAADITSVFPSGGVSALHSILSGVAPNEHGILGSTLFFKETGTTYDMNRKKTWHTGIPVNIGAESMLAYEDIFSDIALTKTNKNSRTDCFVLSDEILRTSASQVLCRTFGDVCRKIEDIAQSKNDTFSLVYWSETARLIRQSGTASDTVYNALSEIGGMVNTLSKTLRDTLFIITADGGYIDTDTVDLAEYPALCECLYMNPTIEPRAVSFFVKPDRINSFVKIFNDTFGSNFLLYPKSEALQLFGAYRPHMKTDDFVGDYVAAATGRLSLRYGDVRHATRAGSGGLTEEEETLPLIICGTAKTFDYEPLI